MRNNIYLVTEDRAEPGDIIKAQNKEEARLRYLLQHEEEMEGYTPVLLYIQQLEEISLGELIAQDLNYREALEYIDEEWIIDWESPILELAAAPAAANQLKRLAQLLDGALEKYRSLWGGLQRVYMRVGRCIKYSTGDSHWVELED